MRSFLYSPVYLADIICNMDLSDRATNELLLEIWEYDKSFLFAEHQVDKLAFIKDVRNAVNYKMHFAELTDEATAVNHDLESIGASALSEDDESFSDISKLFIEMRLKMLFVGRQDYIVMKFRTFLDLYGYKRRSRQLRAYMHNCLYFYHIETFLKGNVPCSIDDVGLDDYITFRVLENKRSSLCKREEIIDTLKKKSSINTQIGVRMNASSFEVTIGNKKQTYNLYNLKPVNGEVEIEMCDRKYVVSILSGAIKEIK